MLSAVRAMWQGHCDGLEPQQQEQLWRLLAEFKDSVREVTFLGHKVGGEGISTMEDILQAVQDLH